MILKYESWRRWHRLQGTHKLFVFVTAKFFLLTLIIGFLLRPIIIWKVGIGPGDVADHPLNLVGSSGLVYLNLIGALVIAPKSKSVFSLRTVFWCGALIQILYLYLSMFSNLIQNASISSINLVFHYICCSLVAYVAMLSLYLLRPSFWTKKAFKIQDMIVLFIAFFAITAKLLNIKEYDTSGLENIWLMMASLAFAIQLAKHTYEYYKVDYPD